MDKSKFAEKQITKEEAIALYDSNFWEPMSFRERAEFQLFQERLCMPFSVFQEAMEKTLGRPVWTHEFAFHDQLVAEFLGEKPMPTFEEICNLIPAEKRIVITH